MLDCKRSTNEKILKDIGKSIKGSRVASNITLEELAEKSEVSKSTLSRIETGKINSTILILIKVYKALGREREIEKIFPNPSLSPILLSKIKKRISRLPQRVRKSKKDKEQSEWRWED